MTMTSSVISDGRRSCSKPRRERRLFMLILALHLAGITTAFISPLSHPIHRVLTRLHATTPASASSAPSNEKTPRQARKTIAGTGDAGGTGQIASQALQPKARKAADRSNGGGEVGRGDARSGPPSPPSSFSHSAAGPKPRPFSQQNFEKHDHASTHQTSPQIGGSSRGSSNRMYHGRSSNHHQHQRPQRPQQSQYKHGGTNSNSNSHGVSAIHIEINKELLRRGEDPEALLSYADRMGESLNGVNVATCLNRLSKAATPRSTPPLQTLLRDPRFVRLVTQAQSLLPQCQAAELSIMLNGISKLGVDPGPAFWTVSRDLSLALLPTFNHNAHFVQLLNAYGRQKFTPGKEWVLAFLTSSYPCIPSCNSRELASLLNSLGNLRIGGVGREYMERLRDGVLKRLEQGVMQPRELATCLNGFGKLAAWSESSSSSRSSSGSSSTDHAPTAATAAAAAAAADVPFHLGSPLLKAFAAASLPILDSFDPQGLAGLINGFAHLNYCPGGGREEGERERRLGMTPGAGEEEEEEEERRVHRFCSPSPFSMTKAEEEKGRDGWMSGYVQAVRKAMPRFNSQDYGIVLNGLASLGVVPEALSPGFMEQLRDLAGPKLSSFNDQELSNLINALGKWGYHPGEAFLSAFAVACLVPSRLYSFTAQGLANVLHAFGRLGYYAGDDWMEAWLKRCLAVEEEEEGGGERRGGRRGEGFSSQGLAMVVLGLSNVRYDPGRAFLTTLTDAAIRKARGFDQQYLSNFWLGCANLNHCPSSSFWDACRHVIPWPKLISSLSLFEASTLLYALAVMDVEGSQSLMGPLVLRACEEMERTRGKARERARKREMDLETESALRQLHQTFLYLECLRREQGEREEGEGREGGREREEGEGREGGREKEEVVVGGVSLAELKDFGSLIGEVWDESSHLISVRIRTSAFQKDVQMTAEGLGLCCLPEARDGPFTLDIVVVPAPAGEWEGGKEGEEALPLPLVVEVDGPTHYLVNAPETMTGSSRLKHRLLAAQRHRWAGVVSVSLLEWSQGGYSAAKKKSILLKKFREAGVSSLAPYVFTADGKGQRQCALLEGTHHSPFVRQEGGEVERGGEELNVACNMEECDDISSGAKMKGRKAKSLKAGTGSESIRSTKATTLRKRSSSNSSSSSSINCNISKSSTVAERGSSSSSSSSSNKAVKVVKAKPVRKSSAPTTKKQPLE